MRDVPPAMQLVFVAIVTLLAIGCSRSGEEAGRVDDKTWNAPDLKTRTSPDSKKRLRADVDGTKIVLKFGEAGEDHPVDIMIHHTETIPLPKSGTWDMRWINDTEVAFEHDELGLRTWAVNGTIDMKVDLKRDWEPKNK